MIIEEDFYSLLIFLMQDELSYINIKTTKDPRNYNEKVVSTSQITRVTKKVLINFMAAYYWVDPNIIKENVKKALWESEFDSALKEVAQVEDKTNRIKLKDNLYVEYDNYIFADKKGL